MTATFLEPGTDATQDLSFFTGGTVNGPSSTISSDSAQSFTGGRSIKSDVTAVDGYTEARPPDFTGTGILVSTRVRFSSVAPSKNTMFIDFGIVGSGSCLGLGLSTGGKLRFSDLNSATFRDGATALAANTWYRVSVSYNLVGISNWTAKIYLNGVLEITMSNADMTLAFVGNTNLIFGVNWVGAGFTGTSILTVWFDDIYVDDRTDLTDCGDMRVTAKRPIANGTAANFATQIGAGGSGYGTGHTPQVNERPLSTTNGWSMVGAGSTVTEEYSIEGADTGDRPVVPSIAAVMGWIFASASGSETGKIIVDGVETNIALTTTATLFSQLSSTPTVYPASGVAIGIKTSTDLLTVNLYEAGVLMAMTIPAETGYPVNYHR